jgi:hypothetical protein
VEITVERMVPILVVLYIERRMPVPAEVYRLLQAHQTVEQCDREVRGQVGGVPERLEWIRLNHCKGYNGLLGSPAMTAQHVSRKEERTINFRPCNKQDVESPGGGPLTVHASFRKIGRPLQDSPARNPHSRARSAPADPTCSSNRA